MGSTNVKCILFGLYILNGVCNKTMMFLNHVKKTFLSKQHCVPANHVGVQSVATRSYSSVRSHENIVESCISSDTIELASIAKLMLKKSLLLSNFIPSTKF